MGRKTQISIKHWKRYSRKQFLRHSMMLKQSLLKRVFPALHVFWLIKMALVKGCGTSSPSLLNLFLMTKVFLTNLSNKPLLCWSTSWTKIQIHSSIKASATLKISKPLQLKLFGTLLARLCRMQRTKMMRLKPSWLLLFSTACLRIFKACNRYFQWLSTGILKSLVKPRRQTTSSC